MSRYPFKTAINEYLEAIKDCRAASTLAVVRRRLNRMDRELQSLYLEGKVSTLSPQKLTAEDVWNFYQFLSAKRTRDGKPVLKESISKDLNDLCNLCQMFGNNCVVFAKKRHPQMVPPNRHVMLKPIDLEDVKIILEKSKLVKDDDWTKIRAYGVVGLYIGAGLRTIELQNVEIANISVDEEYPQVFLEVVKGQETYGQDRYSPI